MIIRSYQITRVVHRSRISERKIHSGHIMNGLRQDLSCAEFCAVSGRSTRQPRRAGCTGLLVSHLPPEGLPALQPHASDANTIQRQHGTRSRHADRQETGRPANHRGGAPTQSTPREQVSLVDSGHPTGRFSTKRLFCERTPASRNHPLRVHTLICRISAPSTPRTRRFPTGFRRSTSSRAILESGWQKFRLDVPEFYPEKELTNNRISVSIPVTT